MAWHGMEEEEEKEAVKQPIISHLLLIPLPPSGVTIATEASAANTTDDVAVVVVGLVGRLLPRTDGRQHHGDEESGREGGGSHILHNNELVSPEFRVATVSTSLQYTVYSSHFAGLQFRQQGRDSMAAQII